MVADETHVSQAMLVKIAKKLGFDGFRSLRAALAKHNQLPLANARQELSDQPTARTLAERAQGLPQSAREGFLARFIREPGNGRPPLTGENGAARVTQLNLLDALFMAVARSNPTVTEANLETLGFHT